jgi:uncharacterized membrane protein YeiH
MRPKLATAIAFAITPIIASFMANLPLLLEKDSSLQINTLSSVLLFTLLFLPYSIVAVLVFGLPVYLICRKCKAVYWWTALLTGGVGGMLMAFFTNNLPEMLVVNVFELASAGMIASVSFWALWRLGNAN